MKKSSKLSDTKKHFKKVFWEQMRRSSLKSDPPRYATKEDMLLFRRKMNHLIVLLRREVRSNQAYVDRELKHYEALLQSYALPSNLLRKEE